MKTQKQQKVANIIPPCKNTMKAHLPFQKKLLAIYKCKTKYYKNQLQNQVNKAVKKHVYQKQNS